MQVKLDGFGPPLVATEHLRASTNDFTFPVYNFYPIRCSYNTSQPEVGLVSSISIMWYIFARIRWPCILRTILLCTLRGNTVVLLERYWWFFVMVNFSLTGTMWLRQLIDLCPNMAITSNGPSEVLSKLSSLSFDMQ